MTRQWATRDHPHRVLDTALGGGPQRGEDVRKVQVATGNRLDAAWRIGADAPTVDGVWGPESANAASVALYWLGALDETVALARKGHLTIGAQRMIRHPGKRNDQQLDRATDRKKKAPPSGGSIEVAVSVAEFRQRAQQAGRFALNHSGRRYSQGSDRWNPIESGASPVTGKMWTVGDCSSVGTWVVWHGVRRTGPDIVNGQRWNGGYTGTQIEFGRRITTGMYVPGDLAFYGSGTMAHVVFCVEPGTAATAVWGSHGSAGGPYRVRLHYRGDFNHARRYVG